MHNDGPISPVGERIRVRTQREKEGYVGTYRPSLRCAMTRSSSRAMLAFVRAVLVTCLAATPLFAQRWVDLIADGAHLRVRTDSSAEYDGVFRRSADDTLRIIGSRDPYSRPSPVSIAMRHVSSVDISEGVHRRSRGVRGVLLGGAGGAVLGLVVGAVADPGGEQGGLLTVLVGMMGAAGGAVLGGVIGVLGADDTWTNVYTNRGPQPSP